MNSLSLSTSGVLEYSISDNNRKGHMSTTLVLCPFTSVNRFLVQSITLGLNLSLVPPDLDDGHS